MNALELKIVEYQGKGWILLSSTSNTAQLRKPRGNPSCVLLIVLLLLGFLPGIIYLLVFAVKSERVITLVVSEQGTIHEIEKRNNSGRTLTVIIIVFVIVFVLIVVAFCLFVLLVSNNSSLAILPLI